MPIPLASIVTLSLRQRKALERIVRQTTNPHRLVRRAQLILGAADGKSNTDLAAQLELSRTQVQCWRDRWQAASASLTFCEDEEVSDTILRQRVESILSDKPRPAHLRPLPLSRLFRLSQLPVRSPLSASDPSVIGVPTEIADEAIKRGIVEQDFCP